MIGLVEMVFAKGVFGSLGRFFPGRFLRWCGLLRWKLWLGLTLGWRRDEHFKHVPQRAGSEHVTGDIQWTAYGDIDGQNHDERAETNQKTPNQPQGKCLVHTMKCDPVWRFVQALASHFFVKAAHNWDEA